MTIAQKIRDHEHLVWNRVYKRTGGKPLSWHKIWGRISDGIIAKMRPKMDILERLRPLKSDGSEA